MKKVIFSLLVASAASVQAADVGVSFGVNRNVDEPVGAVSIGASMNSLRLEAEVGHTRNSSTAIGFNVGREVKVWSLTLTPHVGASYIEPDKKSVNSGAAITTGLSVSYPLTKHFVGVVDVTRNWDVEDRTNFLSTVVTAGVRTNF